MSDVDPLPGHATASRVPIRDISHNFQGLRLGCVLISTRSDILTEPAEVRNLLHAFKHCQATSFQSECLRSRSCVYLKVMRIFATSDLHTDFQDNWLLLRQLSDVAYQQDALIIAGDIADRTEIIKNTLLLLRNKFLHVFYVPGNHELWVKREAYDSIEKLHRILELCDTISIKTRPANVADLCIVPLFSWYDSSFACEDGEEEPAALADWADFHFCKWPENIGQVSEFFLKMNEPRLKQHAPVISFSHFLPRRDLLPPTEYLKFKGLPQVSGCLSLETQIRTLKSMIHVFGHSHISCDRTIDGVRYVQNALRYPKERTSASFPIKMIWNSEMLHGKSATS